MRDIESIGIADFGGNSYEGQIADSVFYSRGIGRM
jgi:hypothetical protein